MPLNPRAAERQYAVGEVYHLDHREERSSASHAHYFAQLDDMWASLPDVLAEQFPTPEYLRKRALIQAGYRDERSIVASSKTEAVRIAAFVRPIDEFAAVSVRGNVVIVWTARSQSMRAMGKREFQASKDAVLGIVADLLGIKQQASRVGERPAESRLADWHEGASPGGAPQAQARDASERARPVIPVIERESRDLRIAPPAGKRTDRRVSKLETHTDVQRGQSLGVTTDERPASASLALGNVSDGPALNAEPNTAWLHEVAYLPVQADYAGERDWRQPNPDCPCWNDE